MQIIRQSPYEFFLGMFVQWATRRRAPITEAAHVYVSRVLTCPASSCRPANIILEHEVAVLYEHAREKNVPPAQRLRLLRTVGDSGLLASGIWWQYVHESRRRALGVRYYVDIGRRAYAQINDPLFNELADRFETIVDVLVAIGLECAPPGDAETMRLYRLWLHTRAPYLADALAARGIPRGALSPTPS